MGILNKTVNITPNLDQLLHIHGFEYMFRSNPAHGWIRRNSNYIVTIMPTPEWPNCYHVAGRVYADEDIDSFGCTLPGKEILPFLHQKIPSLN